MMHLLLGTLNSIGKALLSSGFISKLLKLIDCSARQLVFATYPDLTTGNGLVAKSENQRNATSGKEQH